MSKPTVRETNFLSLVMKADPDHYEEDDAYRFSNARKFKSTDGSGGGVYEGGGQLPWILEETSRVA